MYTERELFPSSISRSYVKCVYDSVAPCSSRNPRDFCNRKNRKYSLIPAFHSSNSSRINVTVLCLFSLSYYILPPHTSLELGNSYLCSMVDQL